MIKRLGDAAMRAGNRGKDANATLSVRDEGCATHLTPAIVLGVCPPPRRPYPLLPLLDARFPFLLGVEQVCMCVLGGFLLYY